MILEGSALEKVASYKLLGLHVTETLKWDFHVTTMLSKASKRVHFLKLLRRAGVSTADLVSAVIRPTVEYACPVWHSLLTVKQSEDIERLQKRALRCIVGDVTYKEERSMFELSTFADRREELMRRFFDQLMPA